MTWYKTGTVAVTTGSNAVLGTGTSFIANARVGDAFRGPDGEWYEVTNIASDMALSIAPDYQGADMTSGGYSLAPMQGYVKDSADALRAATQVIASGVADMQEQVAAATEAAQSAGQSKAVATEQADIATAAAEASSDNKNAAQLAAQQSQNSAQASGAAADRSETARDSIIQSEQAAAASAAAAKDSADRAEEVTEGKAASGANSDITSLSGLTTPLSIAQGGNGGDITPYMPVADANVQMNNGMYSTQSAWTGSPFPGTDGRNYGYLEHVNWIDNAQQFQRWKSINTTVKEMVRSKADTTWGAWIEVSSGGGGIAVGTMFPWKFNRATIPGGSLPHDGQIVTNGRALYPEFWALIQPFCVGDATWLAAPYTYRGMFSTGDGSTNFRMPDDNAKHPDGFTIAAMVLRGDGKNSSGTPGLHQADQFQKVRYNTINIQATGASKNPLMDAEFDSDLTKNIVNGLTGNSWSQGTTATTGRLMTDGANGVPRAGTETRSANSTVIWCTAVAKTGVNAGTVDVTVLSNTVNQNSSDITNLHSSKLNANSPLVTKAWARIASSASSVILNGSGVLSCTRTGVGTYTVAISPSVPSAGIIVTLNQSVSYNQSIVATQISNTTFGVVMGNANAAYDFTGFTIEINGV